MENSINVIQRYLYESKIVSEAMSSNPDILVTINKIAHVCYKSILSGHKLLFAGNGGSAAEAQHMAGEYVSKFGFERKGIAGLALTTDTSILTAIGNDYGYEEVFARQLDALGNSGDVFFGYSTSGTSANIIRALEVCKEKKICSVLLTGEKVVYKDLPDFVLSVPSAVTWHIQEGHTIYGHLICSLVENLLFKRIEWKS